MPRVRRLPAHIANQIAAGEVVERPNSVVKELIENSLDAGASSVEVRLSMGGKRLIEVTDNGSGMSRDDLALSIEPHATSKIEAVEDLSRITTLGFRGEALPSIGAVSRLTISSSQDRTEGGWKVEVIYGTVGSLLPQACPKGTIVRVEDLFLKVPARAKFLKSDQTEYARCLKVIHLFSAAWPSVDFRLKRERRVTFSCKADVGLEKRIEPLLGRQVASALEEVKGRMEGLKLNGLVARPSEVRLSRRHLYFFLNKRPVSSPVLWRAANDAMKGFVVKGNYPAGVIFMKIDPELIDVNVHPTKNEVRFERPGDVYRLVFHSIRRTLETGGQSISAAATLHNAENRNNHFGQAGPQTGKKGVKGQYPLPWEDKDQVSTAKYGIGESSPERIMYGKPGDKRLRGATAGIDEERERAGIRIIGQFAKSFILFETGEKLVILDQHAAHEALIFKELNGEFHVLGRLERQKLLVPEVIDVGAPLIENLHNAGKLLERLGVEAEAFGDGELVIRSVPSSLFRQEMDMALISDMVKEALKAPETQEIELLRSVAAMLSCTRAIKAGQTMDHREMEVLVRKCMEEGITNCPHGRPVMARIEKDELHTVFFRR